MNAPRWGGRRVMEIRADAATQIAQGWIRCARCGRPVTSEQKWDLDHRVPRSVNPSLQWDEDNLAVSHAKCNRAAGGRLAHARQRKNGYMK